MSTAPNPTRIIKTRSGRVLDQAAFEATIDAGLARRERELTSRRAKAKRAASRLSEKAQEVKKKVTAALRC
ncbi:hypothetical protein UCRNP2_7867 [Neofusicoccum parvum UCRNP2]|uniref:Uncharacterized protein n=1 Tax=Botryosphaeria parva (strain UCR-NP2) TaxID=1287680 RepID=R1GHH4_BOTPV|nr:hypothetical protein UCRNP2_7867 [Neofusicoccum parvum UCRNP2]